MIYLSRKHNPIYSQFLDEIREFFGGEDAKGRYPECAGINYPKEACREAKYFCSMKKNLHWKKGGKECYNEKVLELSGMVPEMPVEETINEPRKLSKDAMLGIGIGAVSLLLIMGVVIKRNI